MAYLQHAYYRNSINGPKGDTGADGKEGSNPLPVYGPLLPTDPEITETKNQKSMWPWLIGAGALFFILTKRKRYNG